MTKKRTSEMKNITKKKYLIILFLFTTIINAQFSTQTITNDLNSLASDLAAYTPTTLNKPANFGTTLAFRFWEGQGGSDWRTQLAFSTENDFYYRQSTNNGGTSWSAWNKIYHSGNLNNNTTDFNANHLTAKELAIYSNESLNGWGISRIHWQGHSLIMGSPKGAYAHNSVILRPGGAVNGVLENTFEIDAANGIDNYETRVRFSTTGNSFINAGNVGIGTKNPKNKLDVNGTIHSKEVKVDIDGWSDYVFTKEYNLPNLIEVEKYIKEKGHLKNIPSQKEVIENGINLGEMDSKLLQKIEELTLYIIELNKKIEEQRNEINLMKKNN